MGCMSASDAAPLPRLGEVFFDVRGESRSMRLSWYADTGVAVFSIWQGGTCTGTFRLPITDLPRMVEALQRGPHGHDDPGPASRESRRPPPPRPDGTDSDVVTGQTTAAIYLPPVESDLTGYRAPSGGVGTGGDFTGDYPAVAAEDFSGDYAAGPAGDLTGGYPAGSGPDLTGDYSTGPTPDFTGDYSTGPAGDLTGGYSSGPAGDFTGDYSNEYPAVPADDFTGVYPAEPEPDPPGQRGSRRRGRPDEDSAGYPAEPEADAPGKRGSRRHGRPDGDSGGYRGEPEPDAPGQRGSRRRGRRPDEDSGYQAPLAHEPDTPSYPVEPAGEYLAEADYPRAGRGRRARRDSGGYPDEQNYGDYPDEMAATEYASPSRPYISDDRPEPRKSRGRRRGEPAPESFPYGPPPTSDEPEPPERYPDRH
jgi:hypothetical protein